MIILQPQQALKCIHTQKLGRATI